jgi:2-polyprenyl-3-methyl-5-hydroxy-6-metoxy-1,4-benzoquinol methylase
VSVLDVGSGQGDLLRAIWQLAQRQGRPVRLQGIDLHPHSTQAASEATPLSMGIAFVTADLFDCDPGPTDYIVSSQMAHHLDDEQLPRFLQWLDRHARHGWCVADLHRHWFPYLGFRWLARAAGWHRVVRLDGTLSIARSFTPEDWQKLLQRAGLSAEVRKVMPFRLAVQTLRTPPS